MVKILDSAYAKSDLNQAAYKSTQLNFEERTMLLSLLEDFEDLFDVTLGNWAVEPVELELNPYSRLFKSRYYPIPIINKETFRKDLKRLVEIGFLTPVQQSQYHTPLFIIPKKEWTVSFITDYRRLNQKLVRKPYPLPRIGDNIQQLEGFQYPAALDLNMIYYNIRLSPASQDMTTIVTGFFKFRYNRLHVGMCDSGDIFQAKVDKILGDIEGVKTYINDILVLSKDSFENQIDHLRIIFGRLSATGLKVNAPKFSFGLKDIPYLGYVITRGVIKIDPKKVQGIMDIGRPYTTTEARALIGMVQYYRYMLPRRSHVLAPLTEASSCPKGRTILWNDALQISFKELNRMVSAETLISYPYWKLPFRVHTYASDKQLGDVISQNNKPIAFLYRRLIRTQRNYTTTKK